MLPLFLHKRTSASYALILVLAAVAAAGCRQRPPEVPAESAAPVCPPDTPVPCPVTPPTPSPLPVWQPITGQTIILDAGHGGKDDGASRHGIREKDVNLDLALRTAALLRAQGAQVLLTRDRDVFLTLEQRSAFANRNPNAVFVSIHINASSSNPNATGIETFVLSGEFRDADRGRTAATKFTMNGDRSARGREAVASLAAECRARGPALASSLQRSLTGRLGDIDRGVKQKNLAVLRETYFCPAVLVEVGFVSNARTARMMATEEWRRRAAEGLAEGIASFLRQPR